MGILGIIFILAIILIPVAALVDILRNQFHGNEKLIWVLVILFVPIIGSILYFAIGVNQRIRKSEKNSST